MVAGRGRWQVEGNVMGEGEGKGREGGEPFRESLLVIAFLAERFLTTKEEA